MSESMSKKNVTRNVRKETSERMTDDRRYVKKDCQKICEKYVRKEG